MSKHHFLLALGLVLVSLLFWVFGTTQFFEGKYSFFARSRAPVTVPAPVHLSLVEFTDLRPTGMQDNLGWGGSNSVRNALREMQPALASCKKWHNALTIPVLLDVKIDAKAGRFVLQGFLQGNEENPQLAVCLRNNLEAQRSAQLRGLKVLSAETYRLVLQVETSR